MSMRALATLAAILVLGGALAGCFGGAKNEDDPVNQTSTGAVVDGGKTGTTGSTGLPAGLTVRAPLASMLTLAGPQWVASGTAVAASLTAPSNANGTVTYIWAVGALPGTTSVTAAKADTGSSKGSDYIAPGATKSITYGTAGIYRMHCHPHPYMRSNVTVVEGYAGPSTVDVYIVDGDKPADSRYVPENIVVGKGTTVVYHNVGAQPHTATALGAQEPALKKVGITGTSGDVTIEGNGWQRVVVAMVDKDGRFGLVEKPIYTTATLPSISFEPYAFEFEAGAPALPAPAPAQAATPKTASFKLDYPATLNISYAFEDAAAAAANNAVVEIHLTPQGETQDVMTVDEGTEGVWTGKAPAGTYTLTVIPRQGVSISGTITVAGEYELVPPAPGAPAGDGHGDHGGHGGH